jgi:hypothetical protein
MLSDKLATESVAGCPRCITSARYEENKCAEVIELGDKRSGYRKDRGDLADQRGKDKDNYLKMFLANTASDLICVTINGIL